jgi:RecA/RadA recombinase
MPSPTPVRAQLDRLLRDLGSDVRRGGDSREARADLTTGIAALDALLGGGLTRGRISELHGPLSSGRTSVALALLARATEVGEVVAVIDAADAFHPESARSAGVQLERVLWARPPGVTEAVRASERLLQARGFAAVLLDASVRPAEWEALPAAVWQRLTRAAAATGTALIVLSLRRVTGAHADLALRLQPMCAHFTGTPSLFDGLEIEAAIARQRRARSSRPAAVRLRAAD